MIFCCYYYYYFLHHYLRFVSISACEIQSQLTRETFTDPLQYSGALPTGSVSTVQGFQSEPAAGKICWLFHVDSLPTTVYLEMIPPKAKI